MLSSGVGVCFVCFSACGLSGVCNTRILHLSDIRIDGNVRLGMPKAFIINVCLFITRRDAHVGNVATNEWGRGMVWGCLTVSHRDIGGIIL